MTRRALMLAVLFALGLAGAADAQDRIVYVVRHAERADVTGKSMIGPDDPPLSKAGEQRAQRLAEVLRSAGIRHIFTTEFQRTRQTAAPLASAAAVKPVMAAAKDTAALVSAIKAVNEPTLVVGHSNTVPEIVKQLGVAEPITLGEQDYDNLFVVIRHPSGPATLLRLHF